jgi:tetratricopeptide (TPR) repeat protein
MMSPVLRSVVFACALASLPLLPWTARGDDGPAQVASLYRESYRLEAAADPRGALLKMKEIRAKAGASYFVALRSAWLAHVAGDHPAAEAGYGEAISLAPKAVEPRLGLTLPLLAQRKWRDLERASREVLALDSNNGVARARLAAALYALANYPDSAVVYRKLLEDFPAELDHQTGLGWCLARMGRRAEARQLFAAVLAVSPDNVNAQQGMALP